MRNCIIPVAAAAVILLASCQSKTGAIYTLYRTSMIDPGKRVHWATFDSDNSPPYNLGNCEMAARLLNANYRASAAKEGKSPDPDMGFWCEEGSYSETGTTPTHFEAEYPTDA